MKYFISDAGKSLTGTMTGLGIEPEIFTLPRYGVWEYSENRGHQVVETSDDLEYLRKKYSVTTEVIKLNLLL